MNVYILFGIGYALLTAYILYQAIMLDKCRKMIQDLKPPF